MHHRDVFLMSSYTIRACSASLQGLLLYPKTPFLLMLSWALRRARTWELAAYTYFGTKYTPIQIAIMAYTQKDMQTSRPAKAGDSKELSACMRESSDRNVYSLQVTSTGQRMQAAIKRGLVRHCMYVQQP